MRTLRSILAIGFIFLVFNAHAQFSVGVKAGTNISKITGKSFNDEFRYNYLVGAFAEIGLGEKISLNPELLFNQSSSTLDSNGFKSVYQNIGINNTQTRAKLNYMSIPILANIRLAGPLQLEVGPQFSILMSSDKKFLDNAQDAFKGGDFSMVGGLKLKIAKFRLGGRYVVGLDNISNLGSQDKWKNQAIQLSVGLALF